MSYRRHLVRPYGRFRSSSVSGSVAPVLCPLAPFPPSSDILPAASWRCRSLLPTWPWCPPFFLPQLTPSSTFMSSFKRHFSWELPLAVGLGRGMTLLCSLELPVSILGSPLRCELSSWQGNESSKCIYACTHTHTRIHRHIYTHSICMCVIYTCAIYTHSIHTVYTYIYTQIHTCTLHTLIHTCITQVYTRTHM